MNKETAKEILDIHITKMISEKPDEYYTFDEIKSQPEYKVFINAMNEFAKAKVKEQREIYKYQLQEFWDDIINPSEPDFE